MQKIINIKAVAFLRKELKSQKQFLMIGFKLNKVGSK